MNYRQIIGEAWVFTQENKKLIVWFAFIPSILVTLVGILYMLYQFYAFKSSALFENWEHSFTTVVLSELFSIAKEHLDSFVPVVIVLVILAILYFVLPSISQGAMIQLIARKKNQQDVRMKDGIRHGFLSFLPLFKYSWLARSFNLIVVAGEIGFVLRNLGLTIFQALLPVIILIVIVSVVLSFIFMYSEYYIVIDDCKITEAMAKSSVLAVKHWDTSIMIGLLMLIIGVRILLQIIFVLLVPVGILTVIYFVAASSLPFFSLVIGAVLGLAALVFASYLGAVIYVFSTSVWVFTFLDLTAAPDLSARENLPTENLPPPVIS